MLFPHSKVESAVIEKLTTGPYKVVDLVKIVSDQVGVTPEAVYLGIRNLRHKRVVVTTKGVVSLFVFWIQELQKFTDTVEQSYGKEYSNLLMVRDIHHPAFHSKTLNCSNFEVMENTFHHVAQSLIQPQKEPTPYFFFGFAPWWMTICPDDADAFVKLLIKYNYKPFMVFAKQYLVDKPTVKRLEQLGCQIVFIGEQEMPFLLEGHYTKGVSIEARYTTHEYLVFHSSYQSAKQADIPKLDSIMRSFTDMQVKVVRRKIPFKHSVLNLFAVPVSFFKDVTK